MSLLKHIKNPIICYIKQIISLFFICTSLFANQDSYVSFKYAAKYYNYHPTLVNTLIERPKSLVFYSTYDLWNLHFIKTTNKLIHFKELKETGLEKGTFIHSVRQRDIKFSDNKNAEFNEQYLYQDLLIPTVMSIDEYAMVHMNRNYYISFRDKVVKKITKDRSAGSSSNRALTLVSKDIGETEVALKIDGNININGQVIFEDKELVGLNQKQSKTWDLDIEQTQRFNIEGTIGDRISIKAHQDSEADFSFENDLNITYTGKKNDIMKKLEAGNIALHLPSSQLVSVGSGSSEGLFGIKMIHQLGPLSIQSIISREQVKKSTKSSSLESSDGNYINAYSYLKDKYYFIDEYFKAQYYPLDSLNKHIFFPYYTIVDHEVWKRIDPLTETGESDRVVGDARVNPHEENLNTDYNDASWIKLKEEIPNDDEIGDYEIDRLLGTIRFNNVRSEDIIAISYKLGKYIDSDASDEQTIYEYTEYTDVNDPHLDEAAAYFNFFNPEINNQIIFNNGTTLKKNCADDCEIVMKLLKATNKVSDPSSPTWELMFKNVYNLGSSDISSDGLELDIIYIGGNLDEQTHSEISNKSFLSIFGLDQFDQNGNLSEDGMVDMINSSIVNSSKGELMFPTYIPFAFDSDGRINSQGDPIFEGPLSFWGTDWNSSDSTYYNDIEEYLPPLNDNNNNFLDNSDDGPAMYYDLLGSTDIMSEHKFQIKVKHSKSQRSSTYSLGFMIVENSEEVRLNGTLLTKGADYTIDYFSGTLNIINQQALDPTANIEISYEENELVSFDQKLLTGIHMKLDFSDNDYLSGGAYYYNQSIIDSKVEIGYEPMRNFLWNIGGKYDTDIDFLTKLTDKIPFIEASTKSTLDLEGEYAKVYPNPNPLGQAFLDDFEASKQTSSPSILQNKWKLSSPPVYTAVIESDDCHWIGESISCSNLSSNQCGITNGCTWSPPFVEGEPFIDCDADNIICDGDEDWIDTMGNGQWDEGEEFTDIDGNSLWTEWISGYCSGEIIPSINDCAKLLELSKMNRNFFHWYNPYDDWLTSNIWPNIETSTRAQNTSTKTLWIQTSENWNRENWNGISTALYPSDYNQERSKYMDIWLYTKEIQDEEMTLNIDIGYISEDMNGDDVLNSEDLPIFGNIGNNILDEGEDVGYDGCLDPYENGYGSCLSVGTFASYCDSLSINETVNIDNWQYYVISGLFPDIINYGLCSELEISDDGNYIDPNKDNFSYDEGSDYYTNINGSEGNGGVQGYVYPDTEDIDGDFLQDFNNDYFTYEIQPLLDAPIDSTIFSNGEATGWKLFRINLSDFKTVLNENHSSIDWSDVRMMRLWVQGEGLNNIGVAKIDIVGSQWEEIGQTNLDSLDHESTYIIDPKFSISVVNSDENSEYSSPEGVEGEYDEYNQVQLKEQSLVMDFIDSGIESGNAVNIKKILTYMSNDNKDNFFAYEKLQMFINGQPEWNTNWNEDEELNDVNIIFRLGKEDEYYELRQPIYRDWDERNHIDINLDELTKKKLDIESFDIFTDIGIDSTTNINEDGCGSGLLNDSYANILELVYVMIEGDNTAFTCSDTNEQSEGCDEIFNLVWGNQTDGLINYSDGFFTDPNDSLLFVCGPGNIAWSENASIYDPNGDNYNEQNISGSEGNNSYDEGEIFEDINLNGEYNSPPDNYDEENEIYFWSNGLESLCGECKEFIIKGSPAINRIEYVMVGVANETDQSVYGQVYINELRFTGVKKEEGEAFRFSGKINFSDLLSFESNYQKEDADFHRLQERLGTGSSSETMSFKTSFNSDKFLPSSWGIKIPFYINYTKQNSTPKYYPYQPDVLTEGSDLSALDEIKTSNRTTSLSSSYNKGTRSKNWFIRNTLDKISLSYSIINKLNSSVTVLSDESFNKDLGVNYNLSFSKDNYLMPFNQDGLLNKVLTSIPIIKFFTKPIFNKIKDTKIFYSPDKISSSLGISDDYQLKIMRQGLDTTETKSIDVNRSMTITQKIFDNLQTNYKIVVGSDIYHEMEKNNLTRNDILKEFNFGLIENISQTFSSTYATDIFFWLRPTIKYNPTYSWTRGNPSDEIQTSTIKNTTNLETKFDIAPKELVEIFYVPENNKSSGSKRRGRRSNSNKKNDREPLFKELNNPFLKTFFNFMHSTLAKISKVQFQYEISENHTHSNILAEQNIDYMFRLGLEESPGSLIYSDQDGQLGSFSHSYNYNYRATITSISITPSISLTGLEFKIDSVRAVQSTGIPSSSKVGSYLPLGLYGEKGIPLPSWGISWSGLEKITFIKNRFKSFKLSHNYKGQKNSSYQDNLLIKNDYTLLFSPLIKVAARSKGKNPLDFEFSSKYGLDIYSEENTLEHEVTTQFHGKIEYSRSKGMYIPIPFFRDLNFDNTVSFSFNTDYDLSKKLVSYTAIDNKDDLILDDSSSKITLTPKMTYKFSKYVSGNIFFKYIFTDDINTGTRDEKDFGFNVTIAIRG